mgnify:CR=1 FL=1
MGSSREPGFPAAGPAGRVDARPIVWQAGRVLQINCDRCDASLEFPDDRAGEKAACPKCGDINRLPAAADADAGGTARHSASEAQPDRAALAGLPPDKGPEVRVRLVRPAMFRARPVVFSAVLLAGVLGIAGAIYFGAVDARPWAMWLSLAIVLGAVGVMAFWKVLTLAAGLEITTKRTIERKGLFSRATSEVLHDNIRNIQVDQTFWQRVCNVGSIGISSSGQDGIEVHMDAVPKPKDLQRTIDLYRPL